VRPQCVVAFGRFDTHELTSLSWQANQIFGDKVMTMQKTGRSLTLWCTAMAICCLGMGSVTAEASTLACWNFNGGTAGAADLTQTSGTCGTCTLTTTFSGTDAFTGSSINICDTDPAGVDLALAGSGNNGQTITFQLDMTGAQDLILTMATRRSTNGFNSNQVSYSINAGAFVDVGAPYDPIPDVYNLMYLDFSNISAMDNQPDVRIRITFNGAASGTGNNRIDNAKFTVNGLIGTTGACCVLATNTCEIRLPANCVGDDVYQGDDTTCPGTCVAKGACCVNAGATCELREPANCVSPDFFFGVGSSCSNPSNPCPPDFSDVKINEVRTDEPVLTDDPNEYIEIVGTPGRSLNGLSYIVLGDQSSALPPPASNSGHVEHFTSLQGQVIPADGHFLIAQPAFALTLVTPNSVDLVVPDLIYDNNDNVTHMLVSGFTGGLGTDVDTNDDCTIDGSPPWSSVVDRVAIVLDPFNGQVSTECHYGTGPADTVGPDINVGGVPFHVYRLPDTSGGWLIGPQSPLVGTDTPGSTNDVPPIGACCYVDQFNATQCNDQISQAQCTSGAGTFLGVFKGNGTTCATGRCEGACCLFAGGCEVKRTNDCTGIGNYRGDFSLCSDIPDPCVCSNVAAIRALACNNGNCNLGVRLCGAVISNEFDTVNSLTVASFQMQDNSGPLGAARGITVFGTANPLINNILGQAAAGSPSGPAQGRQMDIQGSLEVFNGLLEIGDRPASPLEIINVGAHPGDVTPVLITAADLQEGAANAENFESVIVQLNCVAFVDPNATGGVLTGGTVAAPGTNYVMTDGINTFIARAPLCCATLEYEGIPIPKNVVNIRGVLTQFDGSDPRTGGYQVIIRGPAGFPPDYDMEGMFGTPPGNCLNLGACCIGGPACRDGMTEATCNAVGGVFQGVGTTCDVVGPNCPDNLTVKINEVRVSDPTGSDINEYFELKGPPNTPIGNLHYIVIGDGTAAATSGVVENVISLAGKKLDANGFFLAANSTLTVPAVINQTLAAGTFENDDNVTHILVAGFTGATNTDLDLNEDCTLDNPVPWTAERDRIAIIKSTNPPVGTECHYGPPTVGPSGTSSPAHVLRCPPTDTWVIGTPEAFNPANGGNDTPGIANPNVCPCPCPADRNADNRVDGRDVRLYVQMLLGPPASYDVCADFDVNGVVDEFDVPAFVQALIAGGACSGDPAVGVRVVTYNLLAYNGTASQARKNAFKQIMSAIKPDVLVAEEVNSLGGAQDFRDNVLNASGGPGGYALADYTGPLAGNALYYRTAKITYAGAADHGTVATEPRTTDWWKLGVVGQNATKDFYVYGAHLKAGDGGDIDPPSLLTNAVRRNNAAALIRAHADTLAGAQIIVGGDLNFYNPNNNAGDPDGNPNETGWATLTGGAVTIGRTADPLASAVNWHKNGTVAIIHTQSPHNNNNTPASPPPPGVVGGGMDDRFDFLLINSALQDATGLSYLAGTYKSFGNDGLHFNNDINDAPIGAYGDALHAAADHIPVVMELQIHP
jgi:hypothetical protein